MPRVAPIEPGQMTLDALNEYEAGMARWGRMTNMKRTLLHSPRSYQALMEWYPLFEVVKEFLGERLTIIFAHAISAESDCLICTTYMRRILIEWGDDPNGLELDDRGEALAEFGRAIARAGNRVPDRVYQAAARHFSDEQMVALTAFAALMLATNVVNNVLEVELDEYLYEFRDKPDVT